MHIKKKDNKQKEIKIEENWLIMSTINLKKKRMEI